jgi:ribosomal protein S27AE
LPDLRSDPQVASRLPGCKKVCPECGGTGHVNFKRRQQLPAKVKAKERGLSGRFDQYCALESSLMAHHSDPRP